MCQTYSYMVTNPTLMTSFQCLSVSFCWFSKGCCRRI